MNITEIEKNALIRVFEQVPFNEDSFIWFVLNIYIHCQYPEYPVLELSGLDELESVRASLKNLFELVNPDIEI